MTKEEAFWDWFQRNEARLFEFEKDQDRVFTDLSEAMKRVHPDLTFEFSPNRDGVREFVISGGGMKGPIPAVIELARQSTDSCSMEGDQVSASPRVGGGNNL